MSIKVSKYNAEGYFSPTEYEAMTAVLKEEEKVRKAEKEFIYGFRPKVFVCSPFAGAVEDNIQKARVYCRFALDGGYLPFAPHLFFPQFMDDGKKAERELALRLGKVFLDDCKEIWIFGSYISSGMSEEIKRARQKGLVIRRFNELLKEVETDA